MTKLLSENEIIADLFPSNDSDNTKQINEKTKQLENFNDEERLGKSQLPQSDKIDSTKKTSLENKALKSLANDINDVFVDIDDNGSQLKNPGVEKEISSANYKEIDNEENKELFNTSVAMLDYPYKVNFD